MIRLKWSIPAIVTGLLLATVSPVHATLITFQKLTSNSSSDVASQLVAELTSVSTGSPNQIAFKFTNSAEIASSITDIYFDDGTLLGIASIENSSTGQVAFQAPATPGNLPGGNLASPPFETTKGFSADSSSPIVANGVNAANEWVKIVFDLINSKTINDTIEALKTGELRIGLHVQGLPDGQSDGYINKPLNGGNPEIPEPFSLAIWGVGAGLALAGSRFRRKKQVA